MSLKARAVVLAVLVLGVGATSALAATVSGDGVLVGSTGPDTITAGNGNDTVWGLGTPDGTTDNITVGKGNDQIDAGGHCKYVDPGDYPNGLHGSGSCGHGTTPPNCGTANITMPGGSGADDTVYGNCGPNNISDGGRGQGNDYFYLYGGPNNVTVSNGNDTIDLSGETAGPNYITTGTGSDLVYAQNNQTDNVTCGSKATIVYVDQYDTTSKNCTRRTSSPTGDVWRPAHLAAHKTIKAHKAKKARKARKAHKLTAHKAGR
jgi:hypothetical protein